MNSNYYCVYDLETDGLNTNECNPVQIGAVIVDPTSFEIVSGSEFNVFCKPENIDSENYYKQNKDTIDWHAELKNTTPEKIVEEWKKYPNQKSAIKMFKDYLNKYNKYQNRKTEFGAPIRVGYNILDFDDKILLRLANKYSDTNKYGKMKYFHPKYKVDILEQVYQWLFVGGHIKDCKMDTIRKYFGMSEENAHDALQDVIDEAEVFGRFMRLIKKVSNKVRFKNACKKVSV